MSAIHSWEMYTAIDLFAGAGGTGLGLQKAGFNVCVAVELDSSAAQTYQSNLSVPVLNKDIREIRATELRSKVREVNGGRLDLLAGCPPCQGFTRLRNSNGANDARNDLILKYLEFVGELKPRYALFENVPGIIRTNHGKRYFEKLINGLRELGYSPRQYLLNAADFGVPQHRLRVIVIASKRGFAAPDIIPTHGDPNDLLTTSGLLQPWVTVRDVLKAYPPLRPGQQSSKFPNHVAARTGLGARGKRIHEFIKRVPKDGGSRSDVPRSEWLACHKKVNGYKDVYGRLSWDEPSGTLTGGCTNPSKGRFLHPTQNRALTYREAARLQGFPDTFVFHGARIAQQIGNAVPPDLAYHIARAIIAELRRSRKG